MPESAEQPGKNLGPMSAGVGAASPVASTLFTPATTMKDPSTARIVNEFMTDRFYSAALSLVLS